MQGTKKVGLLMGVLDQAIYYPTYLLKTASGAAFAQATIVGDPDNRNTRDRRRYTEKPDGKFQMADTKVPYRKPQTNQYDTDHTTGIYPSVGGNLQDDFIGKKSRSGRFNNPQQIGRTFLP
jgi:hypothetical protein